MLKKFLRNGALSTAFLTMMTVGTSAIEINMFDGGSPWERSDVRAGGTAEIVDLSGQGGNLENNAPSPSGAAMLTTGNSNGDKAEVGTAGNFGTVGSFINGGALSYDFYKDAAVNGNPSATAAIKLSVLNSGFAGDGFGTFVYEPTWNLAAAGVSTAVPTGQWLNASIDGATGNFWHTGIFGAGNQAGDGSDGFTLSDWVSLFGNDLLNASIVGISVGVGTYNVDQIAYFDNVKYSNGNINNVYDFEVAAVPLPAALPLLGAGFAALGFVGWRRKRKAA